jgi:hypothetical protein
MKEKLGTLARRVQDSDEILVNAEKYTSYGSSVSIVGQNIMG